MELPEEYCCHYSNEILPHTIRFIKQADDHSTSKDGKIIFVNYENHTERSRKSKNNTNIGWCA
jgi:hypothetical protein